MNKSKLHDEQDTEEDIHGKLAHLNAVPLRELSLAKRYAYITLLHPPNSDELGRFMTHGGALPKLPALSDREARLAIDGLIESRLLRKWQHGASDCFELAGGYAFKPDLKKQMKERTKLSIQKRKELLKRRQRRKDAEAGIPFAYEDDGTFEHDSEMVEQIRSKRGNMLPVRPGIYYNSQVPCPPKERSRHKMMLSQPDSTEGCILRFLPSFNPGENLSSLGAVLRFYLLMESDDYGRVSLDVELLHRQLGPVITKRVSKSDIRCELQELVRIRHLSEFKKPNGWFAYLKDSAQHKLNKKKYNRSIPKLYADKHFTFDSKRYLAFFKACDDHSSTRARVNVGSFSEKGKLYCITEYVDVAARRFLEDHEKLLKMEPYCNWSPLQLMQLKQLDTKMVFQCIGTAHSFYYGASTNQPAEWLDWLYSDYQDEFDDPSDKTHLILKHILGMTPGEFVKKAYQDHDRPPSVPEAPPEVTLGDDDESPPVAPCDEDALSIPYSDDHSE